LIHQVKVLRISRGQQQGLEPFVVGSYSRIRLARGECRAQRNSYGELLLRKFEDDYYVLNYYEYDNYYVFIVEDTLRGDIEHEVHVYVASVDS
jgi:hypothetical protein